MTLPPPILHIAPITPDTLPACAALMAATPLWQRYGVTPQGAAATLRKALEEGGQCIVALEGETVAGFVLYYPRGAFARSGYIRLIGVAPERQSEGVGAQLMAAAEAVMGAVSGDVFLLVSDFNTRAQAFYRRRGYAQVAALPDYVIPGVSELLFWKRLAEEGTSCEPYAFTSLADPKS
ncbi:MAG: GNAT family N-acetyltransferase [Anaerolineae bacterium]